MAAAPRRWHSRELPPNLSDLMNKLLQDSASFTSLLNQHELRMRVMVREFLRISEEVKAMQRRTNIQRFIGVVVGLVGGANVFLSVLVPGGPLVATAAAAGAVATGGGTVVHANVTKMMSESGSAEEVKTLGEEFMKIVEPMKQLLVQIHQTCKDLEENFSKYQARKSLKDVEDLQKLLHRVSELKEKSRGAIAREQVLIQTISGLLVLIRDIFRITATPEEDQKLGNAIIQSADHSQKVTEDFCLMREEVAKFRK